MQDFKPEELSLQPLFTDTLSELSQRIGQAFADDGSRRFYGSLVTGGISMANAAVHYCEGIQKFWGGGNPQRALALARLFSMVMLSQTFFWLDAQAAQQAAQKDEGQAKSEGRPERCINTVAVGNLLGLFGDASEAAVRQFLDIDNQFRYEVDHQTDMTHFGVLLLAMACEACGHACLDWSQVSFPVKSLEPLTRHGAVLDSSVTNSINDLRRLWLCHSIGVQAMMKYHEEQDDVDA